jgi:hypothetical protein
MELGFVNLIEWLITGDDPFGEQLFEFVLVPVTL